MSGKKQSSAYEYLYATIVTADWISEEYKKFAEKYKEAKEPLKELYLCICDQVSIDVLELVETSENIEEAFAECRKKHLESDFLKKYTQEIRRIKHITSATEKEVKQMSGTIKQIADNIPVLDEKLQPISSVNETARETVDDNDYVDVEVHETRTNMPLYHRKSLFEKFKDVTIKGTWHKTNSPATFIDELYSKGYQDEQITYIVDCLEEGLSEKEIMLFASPNIPVKMMRKLKEIQQKEREVKCRG